MNPINQIRVPTMLPGQIPGQADIAKDPAAFKNFLLDSIQEVNSMQQEADHAVENLASGGDANPAEVLTAVQKADIAFRLMIQVRNKLVEAYEEVKNIRV